MFSLDHLDTQQISDIFNEDKPFRYASIDNFLPDEIAQEALDKFPSIDDTLWHWGYDENQEPIVYAKDNPFEKSLMSISSKDKMPKFFYSLLSHMNSDEFISTIIKMTGISDLTADKTWHHAGLRLMPDGARQDVHSDAVTHPHTGLEKRLTLLLYLNPSWKKEYGGALELWNNDMSSCFDKIYPLNNRVVLFECNNTSYHGVPNAIKVPSDMIGRRAITNSYLSNIRKENCGRKRALFVARPCDSKDPEIEMLRKMRADNNHAQSLYRTKEE